MSKIKFLRSLTAATLTAALVSASSTFALAAAPNAQMGELIVSGTSQVTVNGEAAQTGRTVFSSSTITTPADASATINLGKLGQVELAPNTKVNLVFDDNSISGTVAGGDVKVAANNGVVNNLAKPQDDDCDNDGVKDDADDDDDGDGTKDAEDNNKQCKSDVAVDDDGEDVGFFSGPAIVYAVLFGAAATVIGYVALNDSNDIQISSGTLITPTR